MKHSEPLRIVLVALVGMVALAAIPTPALPRTVNSPATVIDWWRLTGPGAATAVIRLAAMLGLIYLGAIAALFTIGGSFRLAWLRRLALFAASPGLRHRLSAGALTLAIVATPATAHSQTSNGGTFAERSDAGAESHGPPTRFDREPIVLTDIGPVIVGPMTGPGRQDSPPERHAARLTHNDVESNSGEWVVESGDHLWAVAEQTLKSAGNATDVDAIASYWRRMIAANETVLNGNPDLIHAGQIITLPPVSQG